MVGVTIVYIPVFYDGIFLNFVVYFEFCCIVEVIFVYCDIFLVLWQFFGYCGIFLSFVFLIFVVCFDFCMTFLLEIWIVRRTAQIVTLVNSDLYEPIRS